MADPDRGFLGLTHNPFIQVDDSFFERGGRLTQLEQLRQPSRWSRRVLLVTGSPGVGKSVLYRQSSSSLEPGTRAARINGSLINTRREVLMSVAQGFGIQARHVRSKGEYPEALAQMLQADGPFLLDVLCPYQEHVLPMIPSGGSVREMITE